ncbi:hypothetical protein PS862_00594 [Pseudomonas fluorescens]|uniref:Uncharacterized protein n=1 Tax=Pseudomonas fluorescens TaxID=294 RepID=A0A5E7GXL9_PSEFL|nr:hypothetical protein [Pseudomonas fluorescens]VVO56649.1 hypothetical protein PS862_00594 [Pseudomonas fluorescens]
MDLKTIAGLDLAAYSDAFERDFAGRKIKAVQGRALLDQRGAAGSLLGGNLISTARGMTRQDKRDVNSSVRYAQWYASQERNHETDAQGWFSLFAVVLWDMGWEVDEERVVEKSYNNFSGRVSQTYLTRIAAVNSQMAKVTQDMFEALLANASMLGSLSKESRRGREFAIAPAEYDQQGRLSLDLNDFSLKARSQRENFLFWDWSEGNVTLTHRAAPFTLNRVRFEEVRSQLSDRLDRIADAIFEFYQERL